MAKKFGSELFSEYVKHNSETQKKQYKEGRKAFYEHFFPQYWINKGYSEEEANEIVNTRKRKAAERSKIALKNCKRITNTQLEYYLNKGLSLEDAKKALAERQATCSLKSFIKRYGEEEGTRRYHERNEKWQNALNNKSPEEKERIYQERVAGFAKAHIESVSKKETKIFDLIEKELNLKIERQFPIEHKNKIYLFDGKFKNILLEFNGDYWHCNPKTYIESYYHPIRKQFAKEVWAYDDFKCNVVGKDYKKFIIWENELHDSDKIIERFRLFISGSGN